MARLGPHSNDLADTRSNHRVKHKPDLASIIGVVCVLLFIGFIVFRGYQHHQWRKENPPVIIPGQAEFKAADKLILSDKEGTSFGNTEEARELARQYSEIMRRFRDKLFTRGNTGKISFTKGSFLTYCHQDADSCVFLVHVPQLRHYTEEAKEQMVEVAWLSANTCLEQSGTTNTKLGLGVKGVMYYCGVLEGNYTPGSIAKYTGNVRTDSDFKDMKKLYPFFAAEESY